MLKNILIMGDSWGVGAYTYTGEPVDGIEAIRDSGLGHFLAEAGATVSSIAVAGSSNIEQFEKLNHYLTTHTDIDYIVWFQTEATRDILYMPAYGDKFKDLVARVLNQNYITAQSVYEKFNIPFIVVGCLSAVSVDIKQYSFAHIVIESWLDELSEMKYHIPLNLHCNSLRKVLEIHTFDDIKFINSELSKMIYLETKLETHQSFSDGVHPSKDSFAKLASTIIKLLNVTSNN